MMERICITGIGSELQGVGRLMDGRAAFVPGALPGETVEIELAREAKRYCEARLVRVLEASPHRVFPTCPYAGRCGGCVARHMEYAYSLELKRQRVRDALVRIGGVRDLQVFETIGCTDPDRSRNKAEYVVELRNGKLCVGCLEGRSRRVVPVEDCLLQRPESIRALNWISNHLEGFACAPHMRGLVTRVNRVGELGVVLTGDAPLGRELSDLAAEMRRDLSELVSLFYCRLRPRPNHALDGSCVRIFGAETMTDQLLGLRFELSPQSFLQVNPVQAEALYKVALGAVEVGEGMRLLDAYCGAGTITLAAAARGARCIGVEIVAAAIENARHNAECNGLSQRVQFICADAARGIPQRIARAERFDAAILDPPRGGADAALLHALADAEVARIAYISCNPGTLARDVKLLRERGYRLQWAQPVDMFPWTEHVETIVLLQRETL